MHIVGSYKSHCLHKLPAWHGTQTPLNRTKPTAHF